MGLLMEGITFRQGEIISPDAMCFPCKTENHKTRRLTREKFLHYLTSFTRSRSRISNSFSCQNLWQKRGQSILELFRVHFIDVLPISKNSGFGFLYFEYFGILHEQSRKLANKKQPSWDGFPKFTTRHNMRSALFCSRKVIDTWVDFQSWGVGPDSWSSLGERKQGPCLLLSFGNERKAGGRFPQGRASKQLSFLDLPLIFSQLCDRWPLTCCVINPTAQMCGSIPSWQTLSAAPPQLQSHLWQLAGTSLSIWFLKPTVWSSLKRQNGIVDMSSCFSFYRN